MPSFEKLNNGKIKAVISMGRGRRQSKTFPDRQKAKIWAFENERLKAQDILPTGRKTLFTDFYDMWFENIRKPDLKEATMKNYYNAAKINHLLFEGMTLGEFEEHLPIQRILDKYGETKSQKTVTEYIKKLRAVLRYALQEQMIFHDITSALKPRGLKKPTRRNHALNMTDFEKLRRYLFEHHETNFNLITLLATETGARRGELLALTKSDLIAETHEISLTKSLSPDSNDLSMKTAASERVVSVTPDVFQMLVDKEPNELGRIFDTDNFQHAALLRKLLVSLDIEPTTFHGLRDSSSSYIFAKFGEEHADQAIMYISKRLGHADIATTQKYYLELMPEAKMKQDAIALNILNSAR